MANGLKIVIPVSFTDDTLEVLKDDPILTNGSLVLIDPTSLADPLPSGVPLNGATIPNIAKKEAAELLGLTQSDATLLSTYNVGAGWVEGTTGKQERTSTGGIHVIPSRTSGGASNQGVDIRLPTAVTNYIIANPTHDYYISLWRHLTRTTGSGTFPVNFGIGGTSSNSLFLYQGAATPVSGDARRLGGRNVDGSASNTTGKALHSIGIRGVVGTLTSTTSGAIWGLAQSRNNGTLASLPAFALYRVYVEDLTVSGRTYAEVDAISLSTYTTEVLTTGGRYFGDTIPTDPATIP